MTLRDLIRHNRGLKIVSFLLANYFFTPPFHTLVVEQRDSVVALVVFVLVALTVSVTVDLADTDRHHEPLTLDGAHATLATTIDGWRRYAGGLTYDGGLRQGGEQSA